MSEELTNKGISIIGRPGDSHSNAIAVIGTARGGTSMVAGAMSKLGIFMGDQATPPVFEDLRLSNPFEKGHFDEAKQVSQEYSAKNGRWGWKRPSTIDHLDKVHSTLNAPRYIFIYKDIMSIAQRNAISMLAEILPGMERSLSQYAKTVDFLRSQPVFAMLVSYEKAMTESENFVNELIKFCDINPTSEQIQAAKKFITPNPEQYLENSRITKAEGRLGGIDNRRIYGWARLVHTNKPASIEIYLNNQLIGTTKANHHRQDLDKRFNQACAFYFDIPDNIKLKIGDTIRAKSANDVRDLDNSPTSIK